MPSLINYHFHDELSADGTAPLALHCAAADGRFRSIGVTNHAETLDGGREWRADPDEMIERFGRRAESVRAAAARYPGRNSPCTRRVVRWSELRSGAADTYSG